MAHELAHVFHIATKIVKQNEVDEELQASETMRRWGYDDKLIDVYRIKTRFYPDASHEIVEFIKDQLNKLQ